ncbi:hypothetical protein ACFVR6_10745 [Microbacterium sp. NPDC058021]|uniref:hypothetical protein n=1 Tax=Microbacterium sp. NPDC058021 TaxID=3346306 RepID=UPI0036DE3F91
MGIDDVVNKSKEFLEQNKEKIEQTLRSDKAEEVSDKVLGAAAEFVKKITPDSADAKVDEVRDKVDGAVGTESAGGAKTASDGSAATPAETAAPAEGKDAAPPAGGSA